MPFNKRGLIFSWHGRILCPLWPDYIEKPAGWQINAGNFPTGKGSRQILWYCIVPVKLFHIERGFNSRTEIYDREME
jgi:hypothetical protein